MTKRFYEIADKKEIGFI